MVAEMALVVAAMPVPKAQAPYLGTTLRGLSEGGVPRKKVEKLCKNWVTSFYTLKIEGKRLIRCFLKPIVGYVGLQKWEMGLRTYFVKIRR